MQLYLELYTVCPFMSTVHNLLMCYWMCHWSWGSINESPALCKWSTFPVYHLEKKTRIKPDQMEGVQRSLNRSWISMLQFCDRLTLFEDAIHQIAKLTSDTVEVKFLTQADIESIVYFATHQYNL